MSMTEDDTELKDLKVDGTEVDGQTDQQKDNDCQPENGIEEAGDDERAKTGVESEPQQNQQEEEQANEEGHEVVNGQSGTDHAAQDSNPELQPNEGGNDGDDKAEDEVTPGQVEQEEQEEVKERGDAQEEDGVKGTPNSKPVAGGVKRVLSSGVFGGESSSSYNNKTLQAALQRRKSHERVNIDLQTDHRNLPLLRLPKQSIRPKHP